MAGAGKVSYEVAEALALKEYEKYRVVQDKNYISDFDRDVKKLLENIGPCGNPPAGGAG